MIVDLPNTHNTPNTIRNPEEHFLGLAPFLQMNLLKIDLVPLSKRLFAQLEADPNNTDVLMNLSILLQIFNQLEAGMAAQNLALGLSRVYHLPAVKEPAKFKLLVLMVPGDISENTPIDCLLDGESVEIIFYYLNVENLENLLPVAIPEHDALLVGPCDSARNAPVIAKLEEVLQDWPRPMINQPQFIKNTERVRASRLLKDMSSLVMPETFLTDRKTLVKICETHQGLYEVFEACRYPIIIRPRDSHGGQGLKRVENDVALMDYLVASKEDVFFVSNFIDYSQDGKEYIKLRIVLVEGKPYVSHVAISEDWMIHYLNAKMEEDDRKKAYEARFMKTFDAFVARHQAAFDAIYQKSGLDYLGIDCAETKSGELLIFEIDHVMIVHGMDDEHLFPYKQAHIQKLKTAFMQMIEHKVKTFSVQERV